MRILVAILLFCAVAILVFLAFIYSGIYNVAATQEHNPLVYWVLNTLQERSVQAHAGNEDLPEITGNRELKQIGYRHYQGSCMMCHGAPGIERSAVGKGLNPHPPNLSEEIPEWAAAEVFWILKHGIRMTGMPAFGPTHSREDLAGMTAFALELPQLSRQEFLRYGSPGESAQDTVRQ